MGLLERARVARQKLQDMHDRRVKEAEDRARAKMARARTKADREKAKLELKREKIALKRELYEAKIATQKAKTAMEKARKEAGDLTVGERLTKVGSRAGRALFPDFYKKRKPRKRKKVVTRKRR